MAILIYRKGQSVSMIKYKSLFFIYIQLSLQSYNLIVNNYLASYFCWTIHNCCPLCFL